MPLDTNWRFTTNQYISEKDGSDANSGTAQNAPWKTLDKIMSSSIGTATQQSIRTGYYSGGNYITGQPQLNSNNAKNLIGDGVVVIDGAGFSPFYQGNQALNQGFSATNILFINIQNFTNGNALNRSNRFFDCVFKDGINVEIGGNTQRTLFLNTSISINSAASYEIFRCNFTDLTSSFTSAVGVITFLNCFFGDQHAMTTLGNPVFTNCCFHADVSQFQLNAANIKTIALDGGGTIGDKADGEKFTDTTGGGAISFVNCFWTADPGFNDPANDNYTLDTAPQSVLFNGSNIIGKYGLYVPFSASHPAFDPINSGVSYANVTRNIGPDSFELTAPGSGTVTSSDDPLNALELPNITTINQMVEFFGTFNFFNGEWIDKDNYAPPGDPNVRLTLRIQVYDEVGLAWSPWYEMETFNAWELDAGNLGNGNIDADMPNLDAIAGKRFRVEMTLRDNGV